jgi:carbonic anhydrase
MGHSHCGGVRAFVEHRGRTVPGDFIDSWMSLMAPAANAVGDTDGATGPDYLSRLEQASVVTTLGNLLTFPEIRTRVDDGRLHLLGAYFDVGSGDLNFYDPDARAFALVGQVAGQ